MARYFQVQKDTALPRAYRAVRDNSGTIYDYETEGIAYDAGEVVAEADIDPRVVERWADGDAHLNSLLVEVSEADAQKYADDLKVAGQQLRLPEHSVEAYVLSSDVDENYVLLNTEQGEELQSAGAELAKEQLEARKEEINDLPGGADERSAIDFATALGSASRGEKALHPEELVAGEKGVDVPQVPEEVVPDAPSTPPGINSEVPVEGVIENGEGSVVVDPQPEAPSEPAPEPEAKTASKKTTKKSDES